MHAASSHAWEPPKHVLTFLQPLINHPRPISGIRTSEVKCVKSLPYKLLLAATLATTLSHAQTTKSPATGTAITTVAPDDMKVMAAFSDRVKQYMKLVHDAEATLPKPKARQEIQALAERRKACAEAVRKARANAHEGDLFTPEVATIFRKLMAQTIAGPSGPRIRASLKHAEPIPAMGLTINSTYPAHVPLQSTPPSLLNNLPALPQGIEYRIVDHALLLREADSNTIADILPHAFPPSTPE